MASDEILVCRLVTGEDVIGKITEGSKTITIIKGFVIIPTQQQRETYTVNVDPLCSIFRWRLN